MDEIKLEPAHTPDEIERRSFEIIDAEIMEPRPWKGALWTVARRCIHALGDISIINDLELPQTAFHAGMEALRKGCEIYTDTRMLAEGLVQRRMKPLGIKVKALMAIPDIELLASKMGCTRSAAAIRKSIDQLDGKIIAIGNAPTALLALLDELQKRKTDQRAVEPALIIGMPVGFVNAAQSKALLAKSKYNYFTLHGRRGGSTVAAACVNAMADLIVRENQSRKD